MQLVEAPVRGLCEFFDYVLVRVESRAPEVKTGKAE